MNRHAPVNNVTRRFRDFVHNGARYRITIDAFDAATAEIVRQRDTLETFIRVHPQFARSMTPLAMPDDAPDIADRMAQASDIVGVGPMAAVAGIMAEFAARAALATGTRDVIVDNGGDVYLALTKPAVVGLYAGASGVGDHVALSVQPDETPLAICSSSGRMGHSLSLGDCDLATVTSRDAALADAAATLAANMVSAPADIEAALECVGALPGVSGVLIVQDDQVGIRGKLPALVRRPESVRETVEKSKSTSMAICRGCGHC